MLDFLISDMRSLLPDIFYNRKLMTSRNILTWGDPYNLFEMTGEMTLVGKTAFSGHLCDGHIIAQQLLGQLNALLLSVGMGRQAGILAEYA